MNHQIKLIHWLRFALSITLLMGLRPIYAADTDKDGVFDALDPAPADIRVTGYQPPWIDTFKGYRVDDAFGSSVSGAGDVNNDGYTDVVVGASRDDNNDTDSGSARIFSGATGDILYTFNGDSLNDNFGSSVSAAGDVNNDGYADVVVGATRDDNNGTDSGSARIFSGATGAILYTFNGDSLNDNFGSSVGAAGDVDNDGYADVVVGASRDDNNGADSGSARIFSGANGAILYTFSGDSAGDYFGFSVSGAGDVNNDGYADVIVGAYGDDNNGTDSGSSRIFSGATGTILYNFNGDSANDRFGKSSGVGDVNNDGYADVVVGASGNDNNGTDSGSARIFSGANGAILYTFNGDSLDDNFGSSVGGAGDVNNDGYVDVVVGAFTDDNNGSDSGSVRIFSGANGAILYTFNGDGASDYFGFSVSGAGDVNNDGYADVVVGALSGVIHNGILYGNSGSARIFSGALFLQQTTDTDVDGLVNTLDTDDDADGMLDVWEFTYGLNPLVDEAAADLDGDGLSNLQEFLSGLNPTSSETDRDGVPDAVDPAPTDISVSGYHWPWLNTFNGDSLGDQFGVSVSSVGDVNNDGYADVVVGAHGDDNNGGESGSARILSGENGTILYTFSGDSAGDLFGLSVSGAGDVNHDGYADVIVGAYGDDNNGDNSGSARVFSGANGAILYTFNGNSAGDYFGYSVSGAGDVNNDGYADVVVGAYADDNAGSYSGSVSIFSGVDGSILYTFTGDSNDDRFGYSVSDAGDVNNDGYADVVVGAYYDDNTSFDSGSARVFSGANGAILYTFNGDSGIDWFGYSVSGAGDVNNDGYADVIIGAYGDDNNGQDSGSALIFSGANGAILYSFSGESTNDQFGSSVSSAGDVNNDGYADVVVGARYDDNNGKDSGSARIFSGANGAILYTFNGDSVEDYFGYSVSGAGDVNNDGYADVVIGAYWDDNSGSSSGSARIFSGAMSLQQITDTDTDGLVDTMDTDDDADGMLDVSDAFPQDTDNDGIGNNVDWDDDSDGTPDVLDQNPLNPAVNESDLPLNGIYKGSTIQDRSTVE